MQAIRRITCVALATALGCSWASAAPVESVEAVVDRFLSVGDLKGGQRELLARVQARQDDDQARFGLGVVQFLVGVEHLMQGLHAYGLKSQEAGEMVGLPVLRLPAPPNPDPKTMTYPNARRILEGWLADLGRVEHTLLQIDSADVKLPVRVGMVRLDFDGDGKCTDEETLWRIFAAVQPGARVTEDNAAAFTIAFDAGDVAWLRGYCHLLSALAEIVLAHDGEELFHGTAHMFFEKVQSPHAYLQEGRKVADFGGGVDLADLIALVHLIRLPVEEPKRMEAALHHFESVIALSRESWRHIMAETDDDREWVPNPKQQSVVPNVRVRKEMVDAWLRFLDESEDLLAGKRLAPFWRSNDGRGVNVRRVFTEPRPLDLVLWLQGTAATPYLEEGELTRPDVWNGIWRAFGGDFLSFAAWFN